MTKPELQTENAEARLGKRAHLRRKLAPMAYVELGQDNGGILLNLSEGGFAVQSALTLTSREFPDLRFQVPAHQGWLTARGRIVWLSTSKKEAGVQFTELPGEARQEIYKWVSTEGEPEKPTERFPKPLRETRQASKPIIETPYRGASDTRETAASSHAVQTKERARSPQTEPTAVAVAEPPAQDFRFTDYSMFAEVPEKEGIWVEPARRGSLGVAALIGVLVAALFFTLGATVGRSTVDAWLANLGWSQNSTSGPRITPPAPPEQPSSASARDGKETASQNTAKDENGGTGTSTSAPAVNPAAGKENTQSEAATSKAEEPSNNSAANAASSSAVAPTPSPARRNGTDPSAEERRPRRPAETVTPSADVETSRGLEHSILVSPPAPGSRPFYVNLPDEAISASASVAISARRTLEILPSASGRSERVIIGKLISHSEPFYPLEARNRRMEGNVELHARVGRTGEIIGVTPVSGPGLLMSAAATAVREWRYEPTYVDGDPQETIADITVVFRLP